ncbi:MAG: hypothetical protein Q8S36_00555 [Sulfuricurvum sp.]|nr:hypothetical protein [Sulfuricurvum sp.]
MKLTLYSLEKTVCINIQTDQFALLRDPNIRPEQIDMIAKECGISSTLLLEYSEDLKETAQELIELDGSCDYSDHL